MPEIKIKVKVYGAENVLAILNNNIKNMRNLNEPLKKGGLVMLRSIDENFKSSGRPPWKQLKTSTAVWKARHGYSVLPLTRSGQLRRSITYRVDSTRLQIGTSVPYARFHQYGAPGRNLPKRRFLLFQNDDVKKINKLIAEYITGKKYAG